MNLSEYEKVKDLNYLEYCDYLQKKYGIGLCDYLNSSWNKNQNCTRTNEGLFVHHKYEDHASLLCNQTVAKKHPFEWQKAPNLVYCDYLEHLFLHILICENPAPDSKEVVDCGGIIAFTVPELNDLYSGFEAKQEWRRNCFDIIKNDKEVYLILLNRFMDSCPYPKDCLFESYNEKFGSWSKEKNQKLFEEIKKFKIRSAKK